MVTRLPTFTPSASATSRPTITLPALDQSPVTFQWRLSALTDFASTPAMVYGAELTRTLSYRYAADFALCPAVTSDVTARMVVLSMPCDFPEAADGVTIRFAPYSRISSFICRGTATHTDARQNSVAAPTSDAITAIIARERRRNTAPHSMVKNILRFVITHPLRNSSPASASTHRP